MQIAKSLLICQTVPLPMDIQETNGIDDCSLFPSSSSYSHLGCFEPIRMIKDIPNIGKCKRLEYGESLNHEHPLAKPRNF
jgi:hypothetical protein